MAAAWVHLAVTCYDRLVVVSKELCGFWLWCELSRAEETHWLTRLTLTFGHDRGTALGRTELDMFEHV